MPRSLLPRILTFALGILALGIAALAAPAPLAAQSPIVKKWPAQGAWQATLVKRPNGGYICMLNALGKEPHPFGLSFMSVGNELLFMVDDRQSTEGYLPQMTVSVDGQQIATYPTFNDPPMTSTAKDRSPEVRVLIERLGAGKTVTVDARRAQYTVPLDGFDDAAGEFTACRLQAKGLETSTTGSR